MYRETLLIESVRRILYSKSFLLYIPCGTKIPSIQYMQDAWRAVERQMGRAINRARQCDGNVVHRIKQSSTCVLNHLSELI